HVALERLFARLPRANSNHLGQVGNEDLSVADLSGPGHANDCVDNFADHRLGDDHLELDLRKKVDPVLGTPVHFLVAPLPSEAANLREGHSLVPGGCSGLLDTYLVVVVVNRLDFLHDPAPGTRAEKAHVTT